ncbi:MAG TPA: iron-containing alcohol dehydrogenase [Vicinamibacteria bacterium]|nr:iron-containing alcohol dehydrogenase [Vicinamibacteria bacterium]
MINVFSFPTQIHFGPGARLRVGEHLRAQGRRRPLVVTDRGVASLPVFAEVVASLDGLEVETFSDMGGNPIVSQVTAGAAAFRAHGADAIFGMGGGAALDVAKAVALMAHHPGQLFEYEDGRPDARPIDREIPYLVLSPTTSGTGSEVGRSAVISDESTHVKKIVFSPRLLARAVFADPEVTLDLPAKVTAATGMDALTHCIEAYLAKDYHPICDGIALEGLRLAARALPRCVEQPRDLEARSSMMMASMMGAIAFQKGLGLTHSFAHALSAVADLHHGLANGLMIEHALRFNLEAAPEKFRIMAQTIGLAEPTGEAFLRWLGDLKRRIGIPSGPLEAGVSAGEMDRLCELAFADSCHLNNPRPCSAEDFRRLWGEAFAVGAGAAR